VKPDSAGLLRGLATVMWPGITEPRCESCSWAWRGGRMEIKIISRSCPAHRRWR
jgi:hypothetical protein